MENKRLRNKAAQFLCSKGFKQHDKIFKKDRVTVSIAVSQQLMSEPLLYIVVEDTKGEITQRFEINERQINRLSEIDTKPTRRHR